MGTTSKKPGRKSLHPDGSGTLVVRVRMDVLIQIDRLAKRQGKDRSHVVRNALHFWVGQFRPATAHTGELAWMIQMLIEDIERRTGKKWINDPLTGTAVRELVERLIYHLAPAPAKPLTVPPEISDALNHLIIRFESPDYSWPMDEALDLLRRDLGSGFQRNRKVWLKRNKKGGL
jgi:hypothetical protein